MAHCGVRPDAQNLEQALQLRCPRAAQKRTLLEVAFVPEADES